MNKVWTDSDREFIRQNAHHMKDGEIALALSDITGRYVSLQAVRKQRQAMNITKKPGRGICEVQLCSNTPLPS